MTTRLVRWSGPAPKGPSTSRDVTHPPVPRRRTRRSAAALGVGFLNAAAGHLPGRPYSTRRMTRWIASHGGITASRNAAARYTWHHIRVSIRCLLVDDNDAFLKAASVLLQREGMTIVGVASN